MADTDPAPARLQRIERAQNEVTRLARGPHRSGGRSFRMTVPVDPADSDIVLIDGLNAGREAIAEAEARSELDVAVLAKALDAVKRHGGNYVDADHLRWYAEAIAAEYADLARQADHD